LLRSALTQTGLVIALTKREICLLFGAVAKKEKPVRLEHAKYQDKKGSGMRGNAPLNCKMDFTVVCSR